MSAALIYAINIKNTMVEPKYIYPLNYSTLSHDGLSGNDIMPCNKINKPLVVYIFSNIMW